MPLWDILRSNPARHIRRGFAAQALLRGFQSFDGAIELGARGQQAFRDWRSPAVILHVGEFDAVALEDSASASISSI